MEEGIYRFSSLSKFPGVIHGISTRAYGDMRPAKGGAGFGREHFFKDLGIDSKDVIAASLIHGTGIKTVDQEERGRSIPETDGLIVRQKGIFLLVTVADCLPILIYDPILEICGLLHAGWRGIIGQIIPELTEKFKNCGSEPQNLIICIGPGICQRHFIVKNNCLEQFKEYYPSATFVRNHQAYVDLRKAVIIDFKKAGVPEINIEIAKECPSCLNGIYGSFRKEGSGAPASAAVIGMKK